MIVISVKQLLGATTQFGAGASLGRDHFAQIVERIRQAQATTADDLVCFDYTGVEDVSASYVKATLLAVHQCGRLAAGTLSAGEVLGARASIMPLEVVVLAFGTNDDVKVCLNDVFAANGLAILAADVDSNGQFVGAELLGVTEAKAFRTLQLAARYDEVTATLLHSANSAELNGVTGWNNRLAELHRQLLLRRQTSGRQHTYRPLVKGEIRYGKVLSRK